MTAAVDAQELYPDFRSGIEDGVQYMRKHKETIAEEIGLEKSNFPALFKIIEVKPLSPSVLGITYIDRKGEVHGFGINFYIPTLVSRIANAYNKDIDWARTLTYKLTKMTTEHELAHGLSSYLARGEDFNKLTVDVMETVPTYGLFKVAKKLGKHKKAEFIKATNPYPTSWAIGEAADATYKSEITDDTGYRGFIKDSNKRLFKKPFQRLMERAKGYFRGTGVPSYVPSRS